MELNNSAWRSYWQAEVLRQLQANADDGLFMDSLSVPNYLGADHQPAFTRRGRDLRKRLGPPHRRLAGLVADTAAGAYTPGAQCR
ncbi:MAG: hypothetical protein IPO15_11155 [Anaerolineae bacterium]|uniref:hypothetical protein n=1 Tax=Candidatus Amarolinea dominans TaxID=3140696 RepID=UPI003135E873|nr:hypothetical protein [Anaerolineae bacterium]